MEEDINEIIPDDPRDKVLSPKCSKRHERMKFWLDQTNGAMWGGSSSNCNWMSLNIDWATITMEDRICMGIIERAVNKSEYAAVVAIWNTRYGMMKGGDLVDDGSEDEIDLLWQIDE